MGERLHHHSLLLLDGLPQKWVSPLLACPETHSPVNAVKHGCSVHSNRGASGPMLRRSEARSPTIRIAGVRLSRCHVPFPWVFCSAPMSQRAHSHPNAARLQATCTHSVHLNHVHTSRHLKHLQVDSVAARQPDNSSAPRMPAAARASSVCVPCTQSRSGAATEACCHNQDGFRPLFRGSRVL
jgi:hypothetical protein